jgi:NTE family protein
VERRLSPSHRLTVYARTALVCVLVTIFGLAACTMAPNIPNAPLAAGAGNPPPASPIGADPDAPLILVAFSGGGARAAALGLGVLDELATAAYPAGGKPMPLIDQVKVVSSVLGGSVIAAWFGLAGPGRLDELKDDFLKRDNMATLEWQAADPLTWARLAFSGYTRVDALRDLLDRELFHGARFADLRRSGAPFVVMNAIDMESGEVFAFTPQRFDDLCSDLGQWPISVGVAASAAFPVALSPMNLRNYSYESCNGAVPPAGWINADLSLPFPRYVNLEEYKRARYANALRDGSGAYRNEHNLHLLGGGLADNQGVQSLTEVLISPHSAAQVLAGITTGQARRIVVISVNARSDTDSDIGKAAAVPGTPPQPRSGLRIAATPDATATNAAASPCSTPPTNSSTPTGISTSLPSSVWSETSILATARPGCCTTPARSPSMSRTPRLPPLAA